MKCVKTPEKYRKNVLKLAKIMIKCFEIGFSPWPGFKLEGRTDITLWPSSAV